VIWNERMELGPLNRSEIPLLIKDLLKIRGWTRGKFRHRPWWYHRNASSQQFWRGDDGVWESNIGNGRRMTLLVYWTRLSLPCIVLGLLLFVQPTLSPICQQARLYQANGIDIIRFSITLGSQRRLNCYNQSKNPDAPSGESQTIWRAPRGETCVPWIERRKVDGGLEGCKVLYSRGGSQEKTRAAHSSDSNVVSSNVNIMLEIIAY